MRFYPVEMTRSPRRLAGLILALLCPLALAQSGFDDLPSLGEAAGRIYSPQQDKALGAAFMRELRQSDLILDDAETTSYLRNLGRRLVMHSENPGHAFTFFMVNDERINAFAGPAGHIGVNVGLFVAAESESELAAVLAHEIAHVTQRHLARAFEAADKLSLPTTAAILAAILIGTQDGQAGAAALTAASAASLQHQINFTRANEQEADRVGIQTLAEARFDPHGMGRFFERLQKNSRLYGTQPPEFLSTHPVTTSRIAEAETRAAAFSNIKVQDDLDFQLLRARLRVHTYQNPSQVLADVQRFHGKSGGTTAAERYEYALLLSANERHEEAISVLEQLHMADPDRINYRLALGRVLDRLQRFDKAQAIYQDTLELYPGELTVVLPYAASLLAGNRAEQAYQLLSATSTHADNPQVYKLLAQAAGLTNRPVQTHTAMGQYYFLNGFTKKAIEQMELAERTRGLTDYQAATIQARIARLKEQLKAEELE
jgi:predicted Zn-dependent protease